MTKANYVLFAACFCALLINCTSAHGQHPIATVAGKADAGFSGDGGLAINAQFNQPEFIAFDKAGNLYISDATNNRIRMVNPTGVVSTIAGSDSAGYSGDGGLAIKARMHGPQGMAFDAAGNLYFSESFNSVVRKITPVGIISTYAGKGYGGHSGDGGIATDATLAGPCGLAFDQKGNLYITEVFGAIVRRVDKTGKISTIAGKAIAGFSGDGGPATAATLNFPSGITLDNSGNLFITDARNNRVRKVDTFGIITTIAGNDTAGFRGDGGRAAGALLFNLPYGIIYDSKLDLYVSDAYNYCIRKIDAAGIITTIAGIGGMQGDITQCQPATQAHLGVVCGLAFDKFGNLYTGDSYNNQVYRIQGIGTPPSIIQIAET